MYPTDRISFLYKTLAEKQGVQLNPPMPVSLQYYCMFIVLEQYSYYNYSNLPFSI